MLKILGFEGLGREVLILGGGNEGMTKKTCKHLCGKYFGIWVQVSGFRDQGQWDITRKGGMEKKVEATSSLGCM